MVEARGLVELNRLARDLPELQERNMDLLTEAGRMLEEELRSDSFLRSQHGAEWNRLAAFKTNLTKYQTILENAVTSDGVVREKMMTHQAGMSALSGGEVSLLIFINSSGGSREEALKSIASVGLDRYISHQTVSFNLGLRRFYGIERES